MILIGQYSKHAREASLEIMRHYTLGMKILITVNSFQQGGAEKSSLKLASGLALDGNDVSIFTWNSNRDFFVVPPSVKRVFMSEKFSGRSKIFKQLPTFFSGRLKLIFNLIKFRKLATRGKYDVVIGFESFVGTVTAMSLIGARIPVIVSERISPDWRIHKPSRFAKVLRPWIYNHGAVCSVQSEGFRTWVKENWSIQSVVTRNHLDEDWIAGNIENFRLKKVTSLGRFDSQKGFDTLIRAWSKIEYDLPGWSLEIFGRGDITNLYFLMNELGCRSITFKPPSNDVQGILRRTGVFVSSSIYEGFPNVVLEALASRTPSIATTSSDVVEEFESKHALLAVEPGNVDQLAGAIRKLINSPTLQIKLGRAGYDLAKEYLWKNSSLGWYQAINQAISFGGVTIRSRRRFVSPQELG